MSRLTVAVELSLWLAGGALKRQIALSIRHPFVSPMMRDVEQSERASGRVGSIERHPKCLTA